ncbi:MAG: YicC family protein [Chlamydiales bacterium]|nr:YicC family protein [Chlamydiales bacterium]
MARSMTAYARSVSATPYGRLLIEIHSVNRKMLDMAVYLPKELLCFDVSIRKWVAERLQRGQVTVRIVLESDEEGKRIDRGIFQELQVLKKDWEEAASSLGFDPKKEIDLKFLLSQIGEKGKRGDYYEDVKMGSILEGAVSEVLKALIQMKETEAQALASDIRGRLEGVAKTLKEIEKEKMPQLAGYQQRICQRLKEIQEVQTLSEDAHERIYREVAFLVEKADITEEIIRLHSHIGQFRTQLESEKGSIGKTLDFLLQEMNREANTLGAKVVGVQQSAWVIQIKAELEKIREQVQNIE